MRARTPREDRPIKASAGYRPCSETGPVRRTRLRSSSYALILPSTDDPADRRSNRDAYRECCGNGFHRMALHALSGVNI